MSGVAQEEQGQALERWTTTELSAVKSDASKVVAAMERGTKTPRKFVLHLNYDTSPTATAIPEKKCQIRWALSRTARQRLETMLDQEMRLQAEVENFIEQWKNCEGAHDILTFIMSCEVRSKLLDHGTKMAS